MYDESLDLHSAWVVLAGSWREAPDEVAFAAAVRQSHVLDEMIDTAKSVAYGVYFNDAETPFDIHQVDDEWLLETIASWKKTQLSQTSSASDTVGAPKSLGARRF